jgi:uncharacterized protein (DUF697 family)
MTDVEQTPAVPKDAQATAVVRSYLGWSAGAGMLPLPGLDLAAIVGVQAKMLRDIATIYEVPFSYSMVRPLLVALLSGGGSMVVGATAASMVKAVPVVGAIAGMLAVPIMAAASCYATGRVFIRHFESGGTFHDFDPAKARTYYAEQFAAAKNSKAA